MDVVACLTGEAVEPAPLLDGRADGVVWRQLGPHLWVGRSGDTHVGTIEQGRHFTLIDARDHAHPGFRSLETAQSATGPIPVTLRQVAAVSPSGDSAQQGKRRLTSSIVLKAALVPASALTVAMTGFGAAVLLAR